MLKQICGISLPYDNLKEIRHRLTEVSPNLTKYEEVEEANYFKQANELGKVRTVLALLEFMSVILLDSGFQAGEAFRG